MDARADRREPQQRGVRTSRARWSGPTPAAGTPLPAGTMFPVRPARPRHSDQPPRLLHPPLGPAPYVPEYLVKGVNLPAPR